MRKIEASLIEDNINFVKIGTSTKRSEFTYAEGDLPIGWVVHSYKVISKNGGLIQEKSLAILAKGRNTKEDLLRLLAAWNNNDENNFYGP